MHIVVSSRLMQCCPHLPGSPTGEHSKDPEENPSQLQPQSTRRLSQRPPHRLAKSLATLFQPFPSLSHLSSLSRSLLPQPNPGGLRLPSSRS
jgi:hypothetical protein